MDDVVREVVDSLVGLRATSPWLRVIDDARLGQAVDVDPDAAAVIAPYRWLVDAIGDGLKLTQAGHLPPAFVERAVAELGWAGKWYGKANREVHMRPVRDLRETAQGFGLVRKYRGQLLPTSLGRRLVDDPEALWWHVADRLPVAPSLIEEHGGVAYLLLVAGGCSDNRRLLAQALAVCGWTTRDGDDLDDTDGFIAARPTWFVFDLLGLVAGRRWAEPPAPVPPAATRLARAALVGQQSAPPPLGPTPLLDVTITLREISPAVWRRVVVPASMTLRDLHDVIQNAMGWEGYHLHKFEIAGVAYGDVEDLDVPFGDDDVGDPIGDEDAFTIGEAAGIAAHFGYEYDFGDSWDHDIHVDTTSARVGEDLARLVDGAGACPPEDSGGVGGYQRLLRVLAAPDDEAHAEALEWIGGEWDAERFDLAATNELVEMYDRNTRLLRGRD